MEREGEAVTTQEDKRPSTSIPTWHSIKQAAKDALACLETAKRDDGTEYIRTIDGTWMDEHRTDGPVIAAHRQAGGDLMMPDDHRYQMVHDALLALSYLDDDTTEDDAQDELANIEPPIYINELTEWLASHSDRQDYCDEAMEEGLVSREAIIIDRLQAGYIQEQREVSSAVLAWLLDHIEPKEEEG